MVFVVILPAGAAEERYDFLSVFSQDDYLTDGRLWLTASKDWRTSSSTCFISTARSKSRSAIWIRIADVRICQIAYAELGVLLLHGRLSRFISGPSLNWFDSFMYSERAVAADHDFTSGMPKSVVYGVFSHSQSLGEGRQQKISTPATIENASCPFACGGCGFQWAKRRRLSAISSAKCFPSGMPSRYSINTSVPAKCCKSAKLTRTFSPSIFFPLPFNITGGARGFCHFINSTISASAFWTACQALAKSSCSRFTWDCIKRVACLSDSMVTFCRESSVFATWNWSTPKANSPASPNATTRLLSLSRCSRTDKSGRVFLEDSGGGNGSLLGSRYTPTKTTNVDANNRAVYALNQNSRLFQISDITERDDGWLSKAGDYQLLNNFALALLLLWRAFRRK